VATVRGFARLDALKQVVFACASAEVLDAYRAALRRL
jgi:hypothetical protein